MSNHTAADIRLWVAFVAYYQQGSHYLWGTAGNTLVRGATGELMGQSDGFTSVKLRTAFGLKQAKAVPSNRKPVSARECWAVDACYSDTGGQHVCAGRFKRVPMGQVATYFSNPARANKLLATYLDFRASGKPFMFFAIDWMSRNWDKLTPDNPPPQDFFVSLTPRIGFATKDAKETVHQQLIWGESCEGIRHFDCVGLVNGSYAASCGWPDITFEIWGWAHKTVTQAMPLGTPVQAGDILCVNAGGVDDASRSLTATSAEADRNAWHHIGMCVGDAAGSIVQAEEGPVGVTVTPNAIDPATGRVKIGGFNYRGRVPDATLLAWQQRGNKARDTPPRPAPRR